MPLKDLNMEADFAKMKGSEHNDLYNSDGTTKQIFQVVFKVELATEWTFISE
jgi:hypothetical protein